MLSTGHGIAEWLPNKIPFSRDKKTGKIRQTGGKQEVKRSLMSDASELPLLLVVGANIHNIRLVVDTLDALQTGNPGRKLVLYLDKGYDAEWLRNYLKIRRHEPHIQPRKGESDACRNADFEALRCIVERNHSWMNHFRRLLTRWENKA
ncbi:transposase [Salmonella enterica subsp. enterica serovar Soerenga]|nr:transposase [Salmonella enterica subsp. enterica serovar Soerenga str. 695]